MKFHGGSGTPTCSICLQTLGKFGGPATLPCGHNGCLLCLNKMQRTKPECPLCRAAFGADLELVLNRELRELISLAKALGTVEGQDGWQAVTAVPGKRSDLEASIADLSAVKGVSLVPTAPPSHISLEDVLDGGGDVLSLDPPSWAPDSSTGGCGDCKAAFLPLRRRRHHCRLCGGLFCGPCTAARRLLPPNFQAPTPQRCCGRCAALLDPLQPFLAGTISKAVQPAVHDVTDLSAARSWLNSPAATTLEADVYTATNILRGFTRASALAPSQAIPAGLLQGAAGFAVLSVIKGGFGWTCAVGTGLVVARTPEGTWSAPSALALYGLGWGPQMGGALQDIVVLLPSRQALAAFCSSIQTGLGGAAGIAAGPLGRSAEAALRVGSCGGALCYSYSCSWGAFVGASLEGSIIRSRAMANLDFYGRPLNAKQLLLEGAVSAPIAAEALYTALDDLLAKLTASPQPHKPVTIDCSPVPPQRRPSLGLPSAPSIPVIYAERELERGRQGQPDTLAGSYDGYGQRSGMHGGPVQGPGQLGAAWGLQSHPRRDESPTSSSVEEEGGMGDLFDE